MCQKVHPLQACNPCKSAPTECIEPFLSLEIKLPSALILAVHLLRESCNNSPGLIKPCSNKCPKYLYMPLNYDENQYEHYAATASPSASPAGLSLIESLISNT